MPDTTNIVAVTVVLNGDYGSYEGIITGGDHVGVWVQKVNSPHPAYLRFSEMTAMVIRHA